MNVESVPGLVVLLQGLEGFGVVEYVLPANKWRGVRCGITIEYRHCDQYNEEFDSYDRHFKSVGGWHEAGSREKRRVEVRCVAT